MTTDLRTGRFDTLFDPRRTTTLNFEWVGTPPSGTWAATLDGHTLDTVSSASIVIPADVVDLNDGEVPFEVTVDGEPFIVGAWLPDEGGTESPDQTVHVNVGELTATITVLGGVTTGGGPGGATTIGDLTDVTILSPADNDFLIWASGQFRNRTPSQARTALGLGSAALASTADFRAAGPPLGTAAFADVGDFDASDSASNVLTTLQSDPDPFGQYQLESGLGAAAFLNVGTSSGTVAAGNDSRITGAVQSSTKGAANGVAPLDGSALLADIYIPSGITRDGEADTKVAAGVVEAKAYTDDAIAALVNGAPGLLDTLGEIAAQLATDESAVAALTTTVSGKQDSHVNLAGLVSVVSAADRLAYFTGTGGAMALATFTAFARTILDDPDASTVRGTLGLVIGTDVQAHDGDLDSIAQLTTTSTGRDLLTAADAAAIRTKAGTVIGTNVQAWDADLDAIANLSPSNDDVVQRKAGAWTNRSMAQLRTDLGISSFAATVLDDTTQADAQTTLGLGTGDAVRHSTLSLGAALDSTALRMSSSYTGNHATDASRYAHLIDDRRVFTVDQTGRLDQSATLGLSVFPQPSAAGRLLGRHGGLFLIGQPIASDGDILTAYDGGAINEWNMLSMHWNSPKGSTADMVATARVFAVHLGSPGDANTVTQGWMAQGGVGIDFGNTTTHTHRTAGVLDLDVKAGTPWGVRIGASQTTSRLLNNLAGYLALGGTDRTRVPTAPLDIAGEAVGAELIRYSSTATNDDPTTTIRHFRGTTTNATPTNVVALSGEVNAPGACAYEIHVWGHRNSGADGDSGYWVHYLTTSNSGAVTGSASGNKIVAGKTPSGIDSSVSATLGILAVSVTGVASQNWTWHVEIIKRGPNAT